MGELSVIGRGQPCVITGDFNVEPTKVPCLLKGISAGLWVDLQGAWANASGISPGVTCKRDWSCSGGSRRDFVLGCPLAAAALAGCWVDCNRWTQPHFAVRVSFLASRWSVKVRRPVPLVPFWPASWVAVVDKTRSSKSAEVRGIWEVYDKAFEFITVDHAVAIRDALADGNVTAAWTAWSHAAEHVLLHAFFLAGGPVPPGGLVTGRGSALLSDGAIGRKRVRKLRNACVDPTLGSEVHLFRDASIAPVLALRSKLITVHSLLLSFTRGGFTMGRALHLNEVWGSVVYWEAGWFFGLGWSWLPAQTLGWMGFVKPLLVLLLRSLSLSSKWFCHRKEFAIRKWRSWVLEDPLVHPYRWLRPDNVPPAPFLSCDPGESVDGSGVLVNPHDIDQHFQKAWMPFFCRGERSKADLDAFRAIADDLIPLLDEVQLPPLTGDMLYETVQKKKAFFW